jgi:hypothetical protein
LLFFAAELPSVRLNPPEAGQYPPFPLVPLFPCIPLQYPSFPQFPPVPWILLQ